MKQLLLVILLTLTIQTVEASKVNTEWSKFLEDEKEWTEYYNMSYSNSIKKYYTGEELIIYSDSLVFKYDETGKLKESYKTNSCHSAYPIQYIPQADKFICAKKDENNTSDSVIVMDDKLKEEKEFENFDPTHLYGVSYTNETDDSYVMIKPSDKETLLISKDFSSIENYTENELTEKEYEEFWGKYNLLRTSGRTKETWQEANLYMSDDYYLLSYHDNKEGTGGYDLYDKNLNIIYSKTNDMDTMNAYRISETGIYSLEIDRSELIKGTYSTCYDDPKCYGKLEFIKYDFEGNEIFRHQLIPAEKSTSINHYGDVMYITDFLLSKDSLTTFIEFSIPAESNWRTVAVTKYNINYEIEVKTDGNGQISPTHEIAQTGDNIKYEVIPNEGYSLKSLKVSTLTGKEVLVKDDKFDMPSEDVLIEASFVKEEKISNPETSDTTMIILMISILCFALMMYFLRKKSKLDLVSVE